MFTNSENFANIATSTLPLTPNPPSWEHDGGGSGLS